MTTKNQPLFLAVKSRQNSYHPVGLLEKQGEDYKFRYTKGINEVKKLNGGYNPLQFQFPETDAVYSSRVLFPIFDNRVMPRNRPDYQEHLEELCLDGEPDVFKILSVSLGKKVTDSYEVFPKLVKRGDGGVKCDFILRNRHVEGAQEHIEKMKEGEEVKIKVEEESTHDGKPAVKVLTAEGGFIGYCPRYLVEDIIAAVNHRPRRPDYKFTVKRINDTEIGTKVLIRMNAHLNGYTPMSGEEYQLLA